MPASERTRGLMGAGSAEVNGVQGCFTRASVERRFSPLALGPQALGAFRPQTP